MTVGKPIVQSCILIVCCSWLTSTVVAQTPIVETTQTNKSQTITSEELNKVPGSRDFKNLLKLVPANSPGYNADIQPSEGLFTITLKTPEKDLMEIFLPHEIVAGNSFTGTMKLFPAEGTPPGGNINQYYVVIDNEKFMATEDRIYVTLQSGQKNIEVTLFDNDGKQVSRFELPVQSNFTPPRPDTPTSGTYGKPVVIHCDSTGVLPAGAYVKIGGQSMSILTSTLGTVVVENSYDQPGITEIQTNVSGKIQKSKFRNLTLQLSADKRNLTKGETTPLKIVVAGLERLQVPATLTVNAAGAVNMSGGNSQTLTINPADVNRDGTYVAGKTLTGIVAGSFSVKVTVSVPKEEFK